MIRIDGLTKQFPERRGWLETLRHPRGGRRLTVVDGVTCEIASGEFFGLLGPNGAGKTTLFKMLSTLIVPDGGTATVAGHDIVEEAGSVRAILTPVIADERSLLWRLSARENLKLYAGLHRLREEDATSRVEELLEVVELNDAGERMVGKYSSGMKQRLLIARALLARPRVLLLDEPTRSLDPLASRRFRAFLREDVAEKQGCTVLLATHDTEEALELCDRVAVLDHGRLLAVGSPAQLARETSEQAYRVWTRDRDHVAWDELARSGRIRRLESLEPGADGWYPVRVEIPGPTDRVAEVVAYLAREGVSIAGVERLRQSLADLIERIVARRTVEEERKEAVIGHA